MNKYNYFKSIEQTAVENNLKPIKSRDGKTLLMDFSMLQRLPLTHEAKHIIRDEASNLWTTIPDQCIVHAGLDIFLHYARKQIYSENNLDPTYHVFVLSHTYIDYPGPEHRRRIIIEPCKDEIYNLQN